MRFWPFGLLLLPFGRLLVLSGRSLVPFGRSLVPLGRSLVLFGRLLGPFGRSLVLGTGGPLLIYHKPRHDWWTCQKAPARQGKNRPLGPSGNAG
jgi:hypothetical protein